MSNVWFTSDQHFFHKSMVTKGWRPQFSSVEQMNKLMIDRWNDVVIPGDTVWHLGDWGFSWNTRTDLSVLRELHGNIHLITGNHDEVWPGNRRAHLKQREWLDAGFMSVQAYARRKIAGRDVLLSHFPYDGDQDGKEDRYIEYRLQDEGKWLLHGHVHEEWRVRGRQINVGVDVWDFYPVHLETIIDIMEG